MKLKVVVLGEKPQGCSWLKKLLSSNKFDVVAGVGRKSYKSAWWGSDEFKLILKENGIPVVEREDLGRFDYDIIWSMMYGYIIESEHIRRARLFGLNLHEAPLPRYRGCNGYSHAILNSDMTYGTTLHLLDDELDRGAIIDQELFPIGPDETAKELYISTMHISNLVFARNMDAIAKGNIRAVPFNANKEKINSRSSLVSLKEIPLAKGDRIGDARKFARAFDFLPFEPAYVTFNGARHYVFIKNAIGRLNHKECRIVSEDDSIGSLEKYKNDNVFAAGNGMRSMMIVKDKAYAEYYPLFLRH